MGINVQNRRISRGRANRPGEPRLVQKAATRRSPIVIAGCGPGAADLIPPAVRKAAESADVLVGARRLLDLFPEPCDPMEGGASSPPNGTKDGCDEAQPSRRCPSTERIPVGADIPALLNRLAALPSSRKIVVLVTGDPGFHSLGENILRRFGRAACRVIPGISSVQAAFAAVGVAWEDAALVSAHEALPPFAPATLARRDKIAILAGNRATSAWLDDAVRVLSPSHAVYVCSDLSLPEERVEEVKERQFKACLLPSRTIVVFVRKGLLA